MRSGDIAPHILNLGTGWRWVVSFMPLPLYTRRKAPDTHWIEGWVGPRAGLDIMERNLLRLPGIGTQFPSRSVRGQLLYRLSYLGSTHCCSAPSCSKGADCTLRTVSPLSQAVVTLGVTVVDCRDVSEFEPHCTSHAMKLSPWSESMMKLSLFLNTKL
jgi:hypothetical protein